MTIFNFNAGPACLPSSVLQTIKQDIPDWVDGISVLEYGHRLPPIVALRDAIERKFRSLLRIPDHYELLLLHGGAQTLFGLIPLHYLEPNESADYCISGNWSQAAFNEAARFAQANTVFDCEANGYTAIPESSQWQQRPDAKYTYLCDNETIHGLRFNEIPSVSSGFIVADMTSSLGAFEVDFSQYGFVFASTQKNLGVAGLSVVIMDKALLVKSKQPVPRTLSFSEQAKDNSMLNTPNVFAWYVLDLMLDWISEQGGISTFTAKAHTLSQRLYDAIDNSSMFTNRVQPAYRSFINIPFTLPSSSLTDTFLQQAQSAGLCCLKGHRVQGGCRANIYNAMPKEGVDALIDFMKQFESSHT